MVVPLGQGTKHIKSSNGPDTSHLSHYSTTYASHHAVPDFTPRTKLPTGTGYLANFRPVVYYKESLDQIDNPEILSSINQNYNSTTKSHFVERRAKAGPLPPSIYKAGSGFNTGTVNTLPLHSEVMDVHVNTRFSVKPKQRPLLYRLQRKDPVEMESGGQGPRYMTSETSSKFLGTPSIKMNLDGNTVGKKEYSGFTHSQNIEPITYRPDEDFSAPNTLARPIAQSVMKESFNGHPFLTGTEKLNAVSSKGQCVSGFVKGTYTRPQFYNAPNAEYYTRSETVPEIKLRRVAKKDPAEFANMTNAHNKSSITQIHYQPANKLPPFDTDEGKKIGRSFTGRKETTGFCENNDRWIPPKPDPADHYTSYYRYKHHDLSPTGAVREGNVRGSVVVKASNGFTKSTATHRYGSDPDGMKLLSTLNPYQARSMARRDELLLTQ